MYPNNRLPRFEYPEVHLTSQIEVIIKYISVHLTDDSAPDMVYLIGTFFVPNGEFMPNLIITPANLDRLLQLGKSAQSALSTIIDQSNGTYEVKIDRNGMIGSEKQKLKRGLQELVEQGIISQVPGLRSTYKIDLSVITYSSVHITNSSQSVSMSLFDTKNTPVKSSKAKEPYGNKVEQQVSFDNLVEQLQRKQELKASKNDMENRIADSEAKMWAVVKEYRLNKPATLDPLYKNLPGTYTGNYLVACDEFIDELTNETFFYDAANKIDHDNKLLKRFEHSIKSYSKRFTNNKLWNILIELDAIKRSSQHLPHCLDLAAKNEKCSCYENCHNRFMKLLKNDINQTKLDNASYKEHSDLIDYFHDWYTKKYPELTY